MRRFAWFLSVAAMLVWMGCSGEAGDDTADNQQQDVTSVEDLVAQDAMEDTAEDLQPELVDVVEVVPEDLAPEDLAEPDEVSNIPTCEASLLMGPWFVDSSEGLLTLRFRTEEECPVQVQWSWEGGEASAVTEPESVLVEYFGVPMIEYEGFFHDVELGFPADAESIDVAIQALEFETELVVPQNANPLLVTVFGDTRSNHESHAMVVDRIALDAPHVVVHTGDMVSSGGFSDQWDTFFDIEGPLQAGTVFVPSMGNHELGGEGYFDLFFNARWHLEGKERTYVQDLGLLGIVTLDGYSSGWTTEGVLTWLDETLEQLSHCPWLIVSYHEPAYTFSSHGPWLNARQYLHPLFKKHGVDMVVAGHNHCYEHYIVDDIQYVVSGGGGAGLYSVNTDEAPEEELKWFVNGVTLHHHLRLEVTEERLDATVVLSEDGTVFEEFHLEK